MVLAIVVVLASLAMPAFTSIGRARGATEAAFLVAAAAEQARAEAVARNTPIWLLLQTNVVQGSLVLRVGLAASRDGTTNHAATNLQPLGRPLAIERVGMANPSSLSLSGNLSGVDFPSSGLSLTVGGVNFSGGLAITFLPGGEATTNLAPPPTDGFTPRIGIGLPQARGTQTFPADNPAAVVIDGSTGIPAIFRQ